MPKKPTGDRSAARLYVLTTFEGRNKWAEDVVSGVRMTLGKWERGLRDRWKVTRMAVETKRGGVFPLVILRRANCLLWLAGDSGVAAGEIRFDTRKRRWQEKLAGTLATHRRLGVYSAVLAALKKTLGAPIWSDRELSEDAEALWKAVGEYVAEEKQYHNPPRSGVVTLSPLQERLLIQAANFHARGD